MDPNVRAAIYEEAPTVSAPDTAMPAEIAKLVERLRMPWPPDGSGDEVTLPVWVFELMDEAATALAVKDVVLTKAVQEIERLKNLVGDPEGTTAHAEAFLARAERAEARVAELEKALDEIINSDRIERRVVQYYRIYFQEHDGPFAEIARRALEGGKEDG